MTETLTMNKKLCPFLNGSCIEESCVLYMKLAQRTPVGGFNTQETCALVAMVMVSANKPQPPPPSFNIPNLRG